MFSSFLSIFANFRVENLSDQVKCCKKGVTRQNTNLSKKCCEKGAVLRKGGVAKRATSGVYNGTQKLLCGNVTKFPIAKNGCAHRVQHTRISLGVNFCTSSSLIFEDF